MVGLVVMALFVLYFLPDPQPSNIDPTLNKIQDAVTIAKDLCLSGKKVEALTDIEAYVSDKAKAKASLGREEAKGAVDFVSEAIKAEQNNEIRSCMDKVFKDIISLSDSWPPDIQLKLRVTGIPETDYYVPSLIRYGDKVFQEESRLAVNSEGYYLPTIRLPPAEEDYKAQINPVVKESVKTTKISSETAKLCLRRAASKPKDASPFARISCEFGGECNREGDFDPGWVRTCLEARIGKLRLFDIIGDFPSAYADPGVSEEIGWYAPSLATLKGRKDFIGGGYTVFRVDSGPLPEIDANAVSYDVRVNGVPVRFDGFEPDFIPNSFDNSQGVRLEYALQNLNFSGTQAGCDKLETTFGFLKDGKQLPVRLSLSRSYVALRNAEEIQKEGLGSSFRLSGHYVKPDNGYDHEVFIRSVYSKSERSGIVLVKLGEEITALKTKFDSLGLEYAGQKLVAVIRPPLTKTSYGLAVGIVEPSGQVRFTYTKEEAETIKAHLLKIRNSNPQRYSQLIGDDAFLYTVNKLDVQSPKGICDHIAL
ncbi:MAG: hypothetical protein A2516_07305 [Alphaproteobacteria bacterium RIFOXYD12_FULL_60_8]|nr:MAG: hypothetical protein A2516_07305 [Alphaproteobacteria bacterium RIFOXYD12_FULL_60_8]